MDNTTVGVEEFDIILYEAAHIFSKYYSCLLILVGLVCNPTAFLVLSRPKFRNTTTAVYLRFLCAVDTVVVCLGPMRFLAGALNVNIHEIPLFCATHFWLYATAFYSSSWTLVLVTSERVLSIFVPDKVRSVCSRTTAQITVFVVLLIWACALSWYFFVWGSLEVPDPETNTTSIRWCTIVIEPDVTGPITMIFETVASTFLPCFLLAVFNVVIFVGVVQSRRRVRRFDTSGDSAKKSSTLSQKEVSMTLTLVAINATFVLCNFPYCVFVLGPHYQTAEGMGPVGDAIHDLLMMTMMTNSALNFFLYFLTGSRFREEFKAMLREATSCCT